MGSSAGVLGVMNVPHGRFTLIETPTLGDCTIADDRTRHHAPRARMDGWWTAAPRTALSPANLQEARRAAEDCIDETAVLMVNHLIRPQQE